jgi:hypothetical protein
MFANNETSKVFYCAEAARTADEPLLGTATQARIWLLLEVRAPWRAKAVTDNNLPPAVQAHMTAALTAIPGARLLFLKQTRPTSDLLRFFIADAGASDTSLLEIHLHDYDDLLALDIVRLADRTASETTRFRRAEPLYLVCTNGTRDKCCAKFGLPAYTALEEVVGSAAWQCTHIGGHRHAPNVLFLPHGLNYGRLTPDEIAPAVQAYQAGNLFDLDTYRGRTSFTPEIQAAESFVRQASGNLALNGLRLETAVALEDDLWRVSFMDAAGVSHEVTLRSSKTDLRPVSCSPEANKPVPYYERIS